jgi:D-cysteine desulfhydrase
LVHGPTPVVRNPRLAERFGLDLWIKRDDATAGAEAGNKLRKLEYLIGDAELAAADTVVTCGALQSNHVRSTALVCASRGLRCVAVLWADHDNLFPPASGNAMLSRMAGADIRLACGATAAQRRDALEAACDEQRARGRHPYLIPEGGSNGLGALGYVEAMRELREQIRLGLAGGRAFDWVVTACGSGGTAAGLALGAVRHQVAGAVLAVSVGPDDEELRARVAEIVRDCRALDPSLSEAAPVTFERGAVGPGYGRSTAPQRRFMVELARGYGLISDPVYVGKALFGLAGWIHEHALAGSGARVLFVHTGGLAGLLAQGSVLQDAL